MSNPERFQTHACASPGAYQRVLREQIRAEAGPNSTKPPYSPGRFPPDSYPIGMANEPWARKEKAEWLASTSVQRTYESHVLDKLEPLRELYDVEQYGALDFDPERYPLFCVKTRDWDSSKPSVLVTGGVHGYETSGVQGALAFLATRAAEYATDFNILVCPCVSPWGYETINRWNPHTVDPNRSFVRGRGSAEAEAVMDLLDAMPETAWLMHMDLHETTDTDDTEFRPAKAARDGLETVPDSIPDGFYLVANSEEPQADWHAAIIESVRPVTHICPDATICGEPITQEGVFGVPVRSIGTCSSVTAAPYATTTEVYPDSPLADDEQCNEAQVAAVTGALDHLLAVVAQASQATQTALA